MPPPQILPLKSGSGSGSSHSELAASAWTPSTSYPSASSRGASSIGVDVDELHELGVGHRVRQPDGRVLAHVRGGEGVGRAVLADVDVDELVGVGLLRDLDELDVEIVAVLVADAVLEPKLQDTIKTEAVIRARGRVRRHRGALGDAESGVLVATTGQHSAAVSAQPLVGKDDGVGPGALTVRGGGQRRCGHHDRGSKRHRDNSSQPSSPHPNPPCCRGRRHLAPTYKPANGEMVTVLTTICPNLGLSQSPAYSATRAGAECSHTSSGARLRALWC